MTVPYEKIETLYARDEKFNVTEEIKRPQLLDIVNWVVTEKIDGTSMRLVFTRGTFVSLIDGVEVEGFTTGYDIKGRSDNAQLHADLYKHCDELCGRILMPVIEIMGRYDLDTYTLYGEGYGNGIQKGGYYRKDKGFILFDVRANNTYLNEEAVTEAAELLDVPRVPVLGMMSIPDMVEIVKEGFSSTISEEEHGAEGVVAKTREPLYDARGNRLIVKVKTHDWKH